MTTIKNKIFKIFFIIYSILVVFFNSTITYVHADTGAKPYYETSSIQEDLESLKIDVNKTYDTVTLLYFLEYGYGYDNLYSIYLYTYIPLNQINISSILYSSNKNTLTFGFTNNENDVLRVDYSKLNISTKISTESETDNLWCTYNSNNTAVFVKWKVDLTSNDFALPNCENRYYCVSGIELHEERHATATEFLVGNVYKCYSNENKEHCVDRIPLNSVDVDVYHTFYRTGASEINSSLESGWQNQISSCYFSLPKYIGNVDSSSLSSIKASYIYSFTTPILVLYDNSLYRLLYNYLGKNAEDTENDIYFYSNYIYDENKIGYTGDVIKRFSFDLYYNESEILQNIIGQPTLEGQVNTLSWSTDSKYSFDVLSWLFYDKDLSKYIKNNQISTDYVFNGNNLYNYYENSKNEIWFSSLFESEEIANRLNLLGTKANEEVVLNYGNNNNENLDITKITFANLKTNSNGDFWENLGNTLSTWWALLFNKRAYKIEEICPIEKVDLNDVYALTNEEFSNKYFIDINEINIFKTYCKEQQVLNKEVWLLRYDACDYYSSVVNCSYSYEDLDEGKIINKTNGFIARQSVYLNFDILQFGFEQDGKTYVIPAIHSPENVFNDLTAQQDPLDYEMLDTLKLIVALILGAILVVILWPFISPIISFIISLLFKGFIFLFKLIFSAAKLVFVFPWNIIFKKQKKRKRE